MKDNWDIGKLARQGDVLNPRVDDLPKKKATTRATGVLAYGEATGICVRRRFSSQDDSTSGENAGLS